MCETQLWCVIIFFLMLRRPPRSTRTDTLFPYTTLFRSYKAHRAAYDRGETRDYGLSRADLEALVPVVEGRMPLLVSVHRASDIREVLDRKSTRLNSSH